jgi:hypothetical protein
VFGGWLDGDSKRPLDHRDGSAGRAIALKRAALPLPHSARGPTRDEIPFSAHAATAAPGDGRVHFEGAGRVWMQGRWCADVDGFAWSGCGQFAPLSIPDKPQLLEEH